MSFCSQRFPLVKIRNVSCRRTGMSQRHKMCMRNANKISSKTTASTIHPLVVHLKRISPLLPLKIQVATQCQIALIETFHTEMLASLFAFSFPLFILFHSNFIFIFAYDLSGDEASAASTKSCGSVCTGWLCDVQSKLYHSDFERFASCAIDVDRHTYLMCHILSYSFNSKM